jgi:hypothetical protein
VCEGKVDRAGHCYFALATATDFESAVSACSTEKAQLVTLSNDEQRTVVESVANGKPYWLSLNLTDAVPAYTTVQAGIPLGLHAGWPQPLCTGPCSGCYGFGVDGGGFDLADGGTSAPGGLTECTHVIATCVAAMPGDAGDAGPPRWSAVDCRQPDTELTVVCERPPVGHVSGQGCIGIPCFSVPSTQSSKLYGLGTETVADGGPDDVGTACAAFGGTPVSLDSDEERADLVRALNDVLDVSSGEQRVWIGLHFDPGTAQFVWDDGHQRPSIHLWGDKQPDVNEAGVPLGGRAFLRIGPFYDSGLLYASGPTEPPHPVLCQRAP